MATEEYIALEITSLEAAEVARYIDPELRNRDYEHSLKNNFLILGFPSEGRSSLVLPQIFHKHFDPLDEDDPIPLTRFKKKLAVVEDPLRKTPFIQN